ncbi:MAG: sensor histidine kinase [Acidimicrobiia bacterium]
MFVLGIVLGSAMVSAIVGIYAMLRARRRPEAAPQKPDTESATSIPQLCHALDALDAGVLIADASGEVIFRNRPANHFLAQPVGHDHVSEVLQRLLVAAVLGVSSEEELALFGPPPVTFAVRAEPLTHDGLRIGAVAWVRDISTMRRVDQVRRDFVANVSHELKTPIGALTVLAETMLVMDAPEVQHRLADRMVREAERLAQLVEDLLSLSIIEAESTPERQLINIPTLVGDAVDAITAVAEQRDISLALGQSPHGVWVQGNARQLSSALTNLLDNAIKYSDAGAGVQVEMQVEGEYVTIAVIDQGIGIPAQDLERVFERFYRVDRARSRATGGTGLGLSIVRHVMQAHGGDVQVASVEGAGSRFTLRLPRVCDPAESTTRRFQEVTQ